MYAPGTVLIMDGYRGDRHYRLGRVEKATEEVVTVKCLLRSPPFGPKVVYRTYRIEECAALREVRKCVG